MTNDFPLNDLILTYGILNVLSAEQVKNYGRSPSKQNLGKSGAGIIYSHIEEHELAYVYEDGFVLYQAEFDSQVRSTVFPLLDVTIKYSFVTDDKPVILDDNAFDDLEPFEAIRIYGQERIEANRERNRKSETTENLDNENITQQHRQQLAEHLSSQDFSDEVIEKIDLTEEVKTLLDGIKGLTDMQKKVCWYRYYERLTQEDTAKKMGVSRSTVESHEKAAIANLQKSFKKAGYTI
jgi:RNA polymerase sigma factor (sigma-70 family)